MPTFLPICLEELIQLLDDLDEFVTTSKSIEVWNQLVADENIRQAMWQGDLYVHICVADVLEKARLCKDQVKLAVHEPALEVHESCSSACWN